MKMAEARQLLVAHNGFRIHFERREGGMLCSDFFPDRDEPAIVELEDAWKLAREFAAVDPSKFVNVYVIQAWDYAPVAGYLSRKLNDYPKVVEASRQEPT